MALKLAASAIQAEAVTTVLNAWVALAHSPILPHGTGTEIVLEVPDGTPIASNLYTLDHTGGRIKALHADAAGAGVIGYTPGIYLPDNLLWADEYTWDAIAQAQERTLTGAVLVEESPRTGGRPITLEGGALWAWVTRAAVEALRTLFAPAGVQLTLTLHDGRTCPVIPHRAAGEPVAVHPLAQIAGSGFADPGAADYYILDVVRLLALEEPA